jgi:FlgD Ig-like domain
MRKCLTPCLVVCLLTPVTAIAKTFVIPHVLETQGSIGNTQFTFDTQIQAVYTAGLVDNEPISSAVVNVYLLNDDGTPVLSANATQVCNPCVYNLNGATRRASISFDALIQGAGGFAGPVLGLALIEVAGDDEHTALSAAATNSHTSAFDLDFYVQEVPELPAGLDPSLRLIAFPHVFEHSAATNNTPFSFDSHIYAAYGGGVAGSSIPAGSGASVLLYLFESDGSFMQSALGTDVCAPCIETLDSTEPKKAFHLQTLFMNAGGFANTVEIGFALVAINGTADAVALQGVMVNAHTSVFDVSMDGIEAGEVPTTQRPTSTDSPPALGALLRSYPNPLQSTTRIDYTTTNGDATIEIVDVTGRIVARPARGHHAAGDHVAEWSGRGDDGSELPSGVYFARLVTAEGVRTLKMTLVR